jgi:hypothetical protein
MVRALSASRAVRFRSRCYPMGASRIKRRAAPARTLHGLRQQGRGASASDVGRQQHRLHAVPNRSACDKLVLAGRGDLGLCSYVFPNGRRAERKAPRNLFFFGGAGPISFIHNQPKDRRDIVVFHRRASLESSGAQSTIGTVPAAKQYPVRLWRSKRRDSIRRPTAYRWRECAKSAGGVSRANNAGPIVAPRRQPAIGLAEWADLAIFGFHAQRLSKA